MLVALLYDNAVALCQDTEVEQQRSSGVHLLLCSLLQAAFWLEIEVLSLQRRHVALLQSEHGCLSQLHPAGDQANYGTEHATALSS